MTESNSNASVVMRITRLLTPLLIASVAPTVNAQQRPTTPDTAAARNLRNEQREDPKFAPDRHEGDGPFQRLVIRGATLIDGTGGPPRGPVDVVVEGNRITEIANVGVPHVPIDSTRR